MFAQRPDGRGTIFVGHHEPGIEIKRSISPGDSVTLRIGKESILVRDITQIGPQRYKGSVYGFEPSMGVEFGGLMLGKEVEFNESQVFGCS